LTAATAKLDAIEARYREAREMPGPEHDDMYRAFNDLRRGR
jgi:hypothetical protein